MFLPAEDFFRQPKAYGTWGWTNLTDVSKKAEPFIAVNAPPGTANSIGTEQILFQKTAGKIVKVNGKSVYVIVILLKFSGCPIVFGTPVNHFLSIAENPLKWLAKTGILHLVIFEGTSKPIHEFWLKLMAEENPFSLHLQRASQLPPWTDDEFMAAFQEVAETPEALWAKMP